jgi:hypothetical protein
VTSGSRAAPPPRRSAGHERRGQVSPFQACGQAPAPARRRRPRRPRRLPANTDEVRRAGPPRRRHSGPRRRRGPPARRPRGRRILRRRPAARGRSTSSPPRLGSATAGRSPRRERRDVLIAAVGEHLHGARIDVVPRGGFTRWGAARRRRRRGAGRRGAARGRHRKRRPSLISRRATRAALALGLRGRTGRGSRSRDSHPRTGPDGAARMTRAPQGVKIGDVGLHLLTTNKDRTPCASTSAPYAVWIMRPTPAVE